MSFGSIEAEALGAKVLSPAKTPRVWRYLSTLPQGLESYPDCYFKGDALRHAMLPLRERHSALYNVLVNDPSHSLEWIADVRAICCTLACRDVLFDSDTQLRQWMKTAVQEVLSTGIYRALFYVLSPSIMLIGLGKRWSSLRRGTEIESTILPASDGGRRCARVILSSPPNLFPREILSSFAERFTTVVEMAGGGAPETQFTQISAEKAEFLVRWS